MFWTLVWAIVLLLISGISLYDRMTNARSEGFFPEYMSSKGEFLKEVDRANFLEMCIGFLCSGLMFVAYFWHFEWLYMLAIGLYLMSSAYTRYNYYVALVETSEDKEKAKREHRTKLL